MMESFTLILVFGLCFHQTAAAIIKNPGYFPKIYENVLESIKIIGNPRDIDLSGLNIEEIAVGAFDDLTNVRSLNLANNALQELPPLIFSKMKNLEELSLADNKIDNFNRNFVGLEKLKILNITNNLISRLLMGNLFGLTKSTDIIVEGNDLRLLTSNVFMDPSRFDSAITDINPETYESIRYFPNEKTIRLVPIPENFNVKLCMSDDGIVKFIEEFKSISELDDCTELAINRKSGTLDMKNHGITDFESDWYRLSGDYINEIDFSNNGIAEIKPELLNDLPPSVHTVDLSGNEIEIIEANIIANKHLKKLYLSDNFISTIENGAFNGTELTSLSLSTNRLNDLTFAGTLPTTIERLMLQDNEISEIPQDSLVKLERLEYLSLRNNFITNIPVNTFQGLKALKAISFSGNQLEIIEPGTFKDQGKLLYLTLMANAITEINPGTFRGLTSLVDLNLDENRLRHISRDSFADLKHGNGCYISLVNNEIDTIEEGSFAGMNILELNLAFNKISEKSIARGAFSGSTIPKIYLYNNEFTSINGDSFDGILGPYNLHLGSNNISSIKNGDLRSMRNINKIILGGNPLERLENGALCGIQPEMAVNIHFYFSIIKVIQGGVFDCSNE